LINLCGGIVLEKVTKNSFKEKDSKNNVAIIRNSTEDNKKIVE
jgi:hypothetical protein